MIGCIIQARINSTRFPKKILKNLDEENNVLEFVINQLKHSKKIDKIVIATTTLIEDNTIEELAKTNNCDFFRGSENNVLNRVLNAANKFRVKIILEITADSIFIDFDTF